MVTRLREKITVFSGDAFAGLALSSFLSGVSSRWWRGGDSGLALVVSILSV